MDDTSNSAAEGQPRCRGLLYAIVALVLVSCLWFGAWNASAEPSPDASPPTLIHPMPGGTGLSQTRVEFITQDSRGFLWLGTQYGLNRYDGTRTRQFLHDPNNPDSIAGSYIHALFLDRSDSLWVASDESLDRYDPRTEVFNHYHFEGINSRVKAIYQDRHGIMWFGTSVGLIRFDPATNATMAIRKRAGDEASLQNENIISIGEDREGRLWVVTTATLERIDDQTGKVITHIAKVQSHSEGTFHQDRFGTFWLAADGLVFQLDPKTQRLVQVKKLGDRNIADFGLVSLMLEDHLGDMWFGTDLSGVVHLAHASGHVEVFKHSPGQSNSLTSNRVIALFEDRSGDIWLGLHDVFPDVLLRNGIRFLAFPYVPSAPQELHSPLVTTLFEDSPGTLVVGSTGALQKLDVATGRYTDPLSVPANTDTYDIFRESPERIWVGTTDGLFRYNPKTGAVKEYGHADRREPALSNAHVQKLFKDRQGRLWDATWNGWDLYKPESDSFQVFATDKTDGNYSSVAQAPDGALWFGHTGGLRRFDPETGDIRAYVYEPGAANGLSNPRVNSLYFDQSNHLWIGTQDGLNRLDLETGKFSVLTEKSGLSGNVVSCILEDDKAQLWMSTNHGISRLDPATNRFTVYTTVDGLPGMDFTGWNACGKGSDGRMFFGGFSGATVFWPNRIDDTSYPPPVSLSGLKIDNTAARIGPGEALQQSVSYAGHVRLAPWQNTLEIDFAILNFRDPTALRARYRLDGLDHEWIEAPAGQSSATYNRLRPGRYTFHVQGAAGQGTWSEPGASLTIDVGTPWWKTWEMVLVYAAAILLIVWAAYRYRVRQLSTIFKARLEERVAERTRMAREVHDTLLQGLQGLILHFEVATQRIEGADPRRGLFDKAIRVAETALTEGRDAVYEMRISPTALRDLPHALRVFGEELAADSSASFLVTSHLPDEVDTGGSTDEILQILKEAIRNCFRHAGASRIVVNIRLEATRFRFTVVDDGTGFSERVLTMEDLPGHWGLRGMRERAARIGATLHIENRSAAESGGSSVTLDVPYLDESVVGRIKRAVGTLWRR